MLRVPETAEREVGVTLEYGMIEIKDQCNDQRSFDPESRKVTVTVFDS